MQQSSSSNSLSGAFSSAFQNRVPSGLKFSFALGAASDSMLTVAFNAFNFFFYTNLLGVPGTLAGLAITIALIFDAVTDPLIGAVSDRWRSRWGRRHPFMLMAPIPVTICLYFIFSPPESLDVTGLFIWLTVFTILMRSAMTLFHVPHLALGAELSADYTERTRVMSAHTLMAAIGGYGFAFAAYGIFFASSVEYENGLMNPDAYRRLSVWAALVGGSIMLLSTLLTMHIIPKLPQAAIGLPKFSAKEFINDFGSALKNKNYFTLLIGYLFLSATLGTRETLGLHMNTYYWELLADEIKYFTLIGVGAPIVGFFVTAKLHSLFDKKPVLIAGLVGLLFFAVAPATLRMFSIMPENHSDALLPTLLGFYLGYVTCGAILLISAMSALADIADEQELATGRRQEGTFYAARSFFAKASSGLGHLLAGIAIDVMGFPVGAAPGTIDADVIFNLGLTDGPLAIIPGIIAVYFYSRYRLTKNRHQEIQRQLTESRS